MFFKIKFFVVVFLSLLILSCGVKKAPISKYKKITIRNKAITEAKSNDYLIKKNYSSVFEENALDTILVFKNNTVICRFLCHFDSKYGFKKIDGNNIMIKNEKGEILQIDSLAIKDYEQNNFNKKVYFDGYYALPFLERTYNEKGVLKKFILNNQNFYDSLATEYYDNGLLSELRLYGNVQRTYYATGILKYNKVNNSYYDSIGRLETRIVNNNQVNYYKNGIIVKIKKDTSILGNSIQEENLFYANGILKSIGFYHKGIPCSTWYYYDEKGVLKKTEKLTDIIKYPISQGNELAPSMMVIEENQVTQNPRKYGYDLNNDLLDLIKTFKASKSDIKKLNGRYVISFKIEERGKPDFNALFGVNKQLLESSIKALILEKGSWNPYKINGKPVNCEYEIEFEIADK